MNDRTLISLGAIAFAMVIVSFCVGSEKPTIMFKFNKGQALIEDLDLGRVEAIKIDKEGETKVDLVRKGDSFLVNSLNNYPASNREANQLIRQCLSILCAAKVSDNPDNHADLGVDGSASEVVRFLDADGKEMVSVVLGANVEGEPGRYVRLGSSDTVYRSEEQVSLRDAGLDYIDKELVSPSRDDIEKVTMNTDGVTYTIESPEKGKIELQGIPEGKKAKGTEPDGVFGAATYLNFSDFKSAAEAVDLTFDNSYIVDLRNQSTYQFDIAKTDDDKYFVRVKARYRGPQQIQITKTESDEELAKKEAMVKAIDEVDAFNQKHQSWVYEISSWKGESMTKPFDDLIEDDDGKPEEIEASHILIAYEGAQRAEGVTRTKEEARQKAEELLAEVRADPSKFGELARENSDGPSKDEDGALGPFKFEKMAPPFSEAAFALEVDGIADVVETEFGFHVIKRTK